MSETFDLKSRLAEMGITPKKAFGQNFLVSRFVIEKIVNEVKRRSHASLIEIGPGLGALTEPLLAGGLKPRLIELDRDLVEYWRSRGLDVIDNDALKVNWESLPLKEPALLVSNLPYQISTHLVIDRCFGPQSLKHMVLMFQKEVAERLTASPSSKAYGVLSVMAQVHFHMLKVADAAPKDFFPPPKVASRVLGFERKSNASPGPQFLKLLKAGFAFRRKYLLKNLKGVVDKSQVDRLPGIFEELELSSQTRAENLSPEMWLALHRRLQ